MLTLNVSVTALEKQGIKAKQQVDGKVAAFFGQLEGLGIKRSDVEAGNLVISPEYQYPQNKKPELVGYRAQRQLAVKLYQLDKLSELMDTALKAGWNPCPRLSTGSRRRKPSRSRRVSERLKMPKPRLSLWPRRLA